MMNDMAGRPHEDLLRELAASPGRFALIDSGPSAGQAVAACEVLLDEPATSAGMVLSAAIEPPSTFAIEMALSPHRLLVDLDMLFWPALRIDPVGLLRRLSRTGSSRVGVWPGSLVGGRASYSALGRPDHYDREISDVLVLRPLDPMFPDQASFEIERWLT
jgi:hypothetical protein